MDIVAPLSKYKKNNIIIFIVMLLAAGVWFGYDGFFNAKFIRQHTKADDAYDSTLAFNRKAPFVCGAGVVILAVWFVLVKDKKIIATDSELIFGDKDKIAYSAINKIDKTQFGDKGFFVIFGKDSAGAEFSRKISDRSYDNLEPILNRIVEKITS